MAIISPALYSLIVLHGSIADHALVVSAISNASTVTWQTTLETGLQTPFIHTYEAVEPPNPPQTLFLFSSRISLLSDREALLHEIHVGVIENSTPNDAGSRRVLPLTKDSRDRNPTDRPPFRGVYNTFNCTRETEVSPKLS
jgi:hypothetical protein